MTPYLEERLTYQLERGIDPMRRPTRPSPRCITDNNLYENPKRGGWRGREGTHLVREGSKRWVYVVEYAQWSMTEEENKVPWIEEDAEDNMKLPEKGQG